MVADESLCALRKTNDRKHQNQTHPTKPGGDRLHCTTSENGSTGENRRGDMASDESHPWVAYVSFTLPNYFEGPFVFTRVETIPRDLNSANQNSICISYRTDQGRISADRSVAPGYQTQPAQSQLRLSDDMSGLPDRCAHALRA